MEVGEDRRARAKLTYVTELVPGESAAWANLALMALRRGESAEAAALLASARAHDASGNYVLFLSGLAELRDGNSEAATTYLRQAVASDSTSLRSVYALRELIGEDSPEGDRWLRLLVRAEPDNLVLLLAELRRQMASGSVETALKEALSQRVALLGEESVLQLGVAFQAIEDQDMQGAELQLRFLSNVLLSEPGYRQDLAALRVATETIAEPLIELQLLEPPKPAPAVPDDSLMFVVEPMRDEEGTPQHWVGAVALGNDALPAIFLSDGEALTTLRGERWDFPGAPGPHVVAGIDYNFDFRTDLALAGPEGLRIIAQDSMENFTDVTATLGLSASVTGGSYSAIWAADLDLEGDVDLILAADRIHTLRNNGDGTFEPIDIFGDRPAPRNFAWADFDNDGDPDAAWVDHEDRLHLLSNERQGRFSPWEGPLVMERILDITVTDSNSDGIVDLLMLSSEGAIIRATFRQSWATEQLATAPEGFVRLMAADLDNNGGQDLVLTGNEGSRVWLQDAQYAFRLHEAGPEVQTYSIAAVWQAGQLDLVGLDANGQPVRAQIISPRGYHWKQVRPRAARAVGDQRINSFGIGGEVELRAGALYQKQPITQPILHFGMGDHLLADVARITWPNGSVQAEFDLQSDQIVSAQQRLIGSCPWLFTHNGDSVAFVTDFIWRSPLGLRINALETANVMTTEDWVRIRGDQLKAVDGVYDVRITAELWETHFFDHVSLMVVDHPASTEVLLDERFAFPPPEFAVHVTGPLQPVRSVQTDAGDEVGDIVAEQDQKYLDFFGRGDYQGITRDHYIEIDLGSAPPDASWLVASGWIRPTDSSVNVAISHGTQEPPRPLRLEVLSAEGTWVTSQENFGFPSGKTKTILIDLEGLFPSDAQRRIRLHTNLEIYWDALRWAAKAPDESATTVRLTTESATLRYRGFSLVTEADRSSPELPHYNTLAGTAPIWRDLVGYYTRFGEVGELLDQVDDRYVIMNAGDELALRFAQVPELQEGMTRDFVLIGDGWVKDGNLNTTASKYVRPLPSHDEPGYAPVPGQLTEEPVYLRHPWDWQHYHTRFVSPDHFGRGIRLR